MGGKHLSLVGSIEERITDQLSGENAETMRAFYRAPVLQKLDPLAPLVKRFQKFLAFEQIRMPKTRIEMARSSEAPPLAGIAAIGLLRSYAVEKP